ncbi:DUF1853 family protein [Schlegelella sp. S2-27]|uniref:DUF1853 family protein n=1 Tax=Caldimonas mangrovi TaxID=2944811 RepID=A0ABT0YK75_9BURK|nr:DUF1853 family protein [Caldimonas mangrovi]
MPGAADAGRPLSAAAAAAALQDLRWLLLSPPLLADGRYTAPIQRYAARDAREIEAWLDALERDARPLHDFLLAHAAPPLRLGRYAERLLEFFLRCGPTHRLLAANLPLRHPPGQLPGLDHTTRGEIDFLLEDREGQGWHWELAVKFFLCVARGESAQAEDFVGPDRAETLPGKLGKLFERQLAHEPPAPWNQRPWRPAAYTRGWMFYRHDRPAPVCEALAPGHLHGLWVDHGRLAELPDGRYLAMPRSRWMAPAFTTDETALTSRDAVGREISEAWQAAPPAGARRWPSAQLIALMVPRADGWHELQRCFVVPDGWSPAGA